MRSHDQVCGSNTYFSPRALGDASVVFNSCVTMDTSPSNAAQHSSMEFNIIQRICVTMTAVV